MGILKPTSWLNSLTDKFSARSALNIFSNALGSVQSLYVAVGILSLTIALGTYLDIKNESMHIRRLEVRTGLEKIGRLNQELSNMLVMSLYEQNSLRIASYDSVNGDLARVILKVTSLTKSQKYEQEISALSDDRKNLHSIEVNAIKLMSEDKWDEAKQLLFGDEYVTANKTSEIDSQMAESIVTGDLDAVSLRFNRLRTLSICANIGALLLLLWVGIMFSRKTRINFAEQVRLHDEISVAYDGMEERVRERTADLEVTTSRLAAENEERLKSDARTRLILNSAGEGIFGVDAKERVTFLNDAAAGLLGYFAEELIGKEIHGIIHHSYSDGTPYPKKDCPMFDACTQGKKRHITGEALWRKDGSQFLSEYSATPISDDKDGLVGAVIVFRDITVRKRNEEELKLRMEELERFNRLVTGREERMIQLKKEINELLEEMGREKKYKVEA